MTIKMIVTDLDWTLLKGDGIISEYSINILNKCKRENIKLVIATARPYRATLDYAKMIGCTDIICLNGARIDIDGRIFERNTMSIESTRSIIENIFNLYPKCKLSVEANDYYYHNFKLDSFTLALGNNFDDDLSDFNQVSDKILFWTDNSKEFDHVIETLSDNVHTKISRDILLQIQSKDASKYNAIKTLSEYYNISMNEIACFGDDNDDEEMIKKSSCGVAVANARQNVKEVAKYITSSNEDDGVCKFIEQNILN